MCKAELEIIKQAMDIVSKYIFVPSEWSLENQEEVAEVVSIKDASKRMQKDSIVASNIKILNDIISNKYKEFSEPLLEFVEKTGKKKILTCMEKDWCYKKGGSSTTLDEKAWKVAKPNDYAKVFSEFQITKERKASIALM